MDPSHFRFHSFPLRKISVIQCTENDKSRTTYTRCLYGLGSQNSMYQNKAQLGAGGQRLCLRSLEHLGRSIKANDREYKQVIQG